MSFFPKLTGAIAPVAPVLTTALVFVTKFKKLKIGRYGDLIFDLRGSQQKIGLIWNFMFKKN